MKEFRNKVMIAFVVILLAFIMLFSTNSFAVSYRVSTNNYVKSPKEAVILVGDSRVWHMTLFGSADAKKNYYMIYANSKGIYHLRDNYDGFKTRLINVMKKYPNATVVFMLGVNQNYANTDAGRLKVYDSFINNRSFKSHQFVISTVGKTVGRGGSYSNSRVIDFNRKIKAHYAKNNNVLVYDLYAFVDSKIKTPRNTRDNDGLHYFDGINSQILKDLRNFVNQSERFDLIHEQFSLYLDRAYNARLSWLY